MEGDLSVKLQVGIALESLREHRARRDTARLSRERQELRLNTELLKFDTYQGSRARTPFHRREIEERIDQILKDSISASERSAETENKIHDRLLELVELHYTLNG